MKKLIFGCIIICFQLMATAQNFEWVKQMPVHQFVFPSTTVVDSKDNIFISGALVDTVDFDPTTSTFQLYSNVGGSTTYFAKYDSSGNFKWAKNFENIGQFANNRTRSIYINSYGELYILGFFSDSIDVDPGIGIHYLNSTMHKSLYLVKLDSNYNFAWAKSWGGTDNIYPNEFVFDDYENIYICGYFSDSIHFKSFYTLRIQFFL